MAKENPIESTSKEQVKTDAELVIETMQRRERLMRTNVVQLAGILMEKNPLPKSEKKDKKGQPILDENNQPSFYDEMFWATIGVIGSEEGVVLSVEQSMNLEEGNSYLFEGILKNKKFKVKTITLI